MVLSHDDLKEKFKDYMDINGKIKREIDSGRLLPLLRGLYETDSKTSGRYLAGYIYQPSYLSFDYALSYYSLIPEAVYNTFTSATFKKGKTKTYENRFGTFIYRDIPPAAFPQGIVINEENGYTYLIASPEKALLDKLYSLPPINTVKGLQALLFEDLRIEESDIFSLDIADIKELVPLYKSTTLNTLAKLIGRK